MDAFDVHVEERVGIHAHAELPADDLAERHLVLASHRDEPLTERGVVRERNEVDESLLIVEKGGADRIGDEPRQPGIGLVEPAAKGDAIGLVGDLGGVERVEILEHRLAHERRVQRRDAIHLVRGEEGEVPHADRATAVLFDQRDGRELPHVAVTARAQRVQVLGVDQVDDLHVSREQALHERHRPLLEGLRQQRVVRVVEHRPRDLPRGVPRHAVHVHEQAHELGDADHRMRVVELDRDMVRERRELAILSLVTPHEVLQRCGREEDLLPEPELGARRRLVARVEHA